MSNKNKEMPQEAEVAHFSLGRVSSAPQEIMKIVDLYSRKDLVYYNFDYDSWQEWEDKEVNKLLILAF